MFSITDTVQMIRSRWDARLVLIVLALVVAYFVTRLYHILALPIFSDEGIYINWARIAASDPHWRFISLTDGKQPLQTWGTIPFVKLFPDHLLLAGRLFSVMSGFAGLTGMMACAGYLWGRRAAVIGGLLYIVSPYFLLYDRLALVDSAVNASTIWILFFSILLAKSRSLGVSFIFGVIAGIGLLAKSSVLMFLGLSICASIFFFDIKNYRTLWTQTIRQKQNLLDYGFLYMISVTVALAMYMVQRFFSPYFHYILEKNLTFVLSLSEWWRSPFQLWAHNIWIVPLYVSWESGWIIPPLGIIGVYLLMRKRDPVGIYLLTWIVLPFLFIVSFNKVIFPRYLIFFAGLLTLSATYALTTVHQVVRSSGRQVIKSSSHQVTGNRHWALDIGHWVFIWNLKFEIGFFLILFVLCLPQWFAVSRISLPPIDRGQYIEGSTAVWGADELMETVRTSTRDGRRAIILAEGNFGLISDVLQAYVRPADDIEIRGLWPLNEEDIIKSQAETSRAHVYVVFSHRKDFPIHWGLELIDLVKKYEKPRGSPDAVHLYKVKPKR